MGTNKTSLVVMAAGMGSRYGGIKQLDPVGRSGETILEFGLYDAVRAGFDEVVFIIRRDLEADFRRLIVDRIAVGVPVKLVFQDGDVLPSPFQKHRLNPDRTKPWGTAHAVWSARDAVTNPFAVINADDFYGRQSYALVHDWLAGVDPKANRWALAGYALKNTLSENGSVSRGICRVGPDGLLQEIDEHTQLTAAGDKVESVRDFGARVLFAPETTVSMNLFGFTPTVFGHLEAALKAFLADKGGEAKAECYLPAVVGQALAQGTATVEVLATPETWFGVTYQQDRDPVRARIGDLVAQGLYPANLWSPS